MSGIFSSRVRPSTKVESRPASHTHGRPPAGVPAYLRTALDRESHKALPAATRRSLEAQLDADLSAVRIHTGPESDRAARAMSADAFTVGPHIHFAAGRYGSDTEEEHALMAHEIAHTLEPATADARGPSVIGEADSSAEQAADRFEATVHGGGSSDHAFGGRAAGGSDGVVRRHVTHNTRQGLVGSGEDFVTGQGATGRYTFTTRGGWLDRSHVLGHDLQAIEVMDALEAGRTPIRVTSTGSGGAYTTVYQIHYDAIPQPATPDHLEQIAIAIMMDHDRRFETFQRYSLADVLAQTPFSYEDLPSDRAGVEIGLRYRRRMQQAGVTGVDRIDRPGHAQHALRQSVIHEVVNELGATSQQQGLDQYAGFLQRQGRSVDPEGGTLQLPDDYLHSSPTHHSFAPFVDPTLSPVTNPVPWLTDARPDWVRYTFRFTHHEHDSTILALSDLGRQAHRGIGSFISTIFLTARARLNPLNWDQSASSMSISGQRTLSRVGALLWAAANARSGNRSASPADDFMAAMVRPVGDLVSAADLSSLAREMSAAASRGGWQIEIQPSLLAALRLMEVPEWLREWRFIRYHISPEGLARFYATGESE